MRKVLLFVALFALAAGSVYALATSGGLVDANTYLGVTTDKYGDGLENAVGPVALPDRDDAAFIYADYWLLPMEFFVASDDCWLITDIEPGDRLDQPIAHAFDIENTGGVAIDLGFFVLDEDVNPNGSCTTPWDLVADGTAAAADQYELSLCVTADNNVTAPTYAGGDFAAGDLAGTATGDWYQGVGAGAERYCPDAASGVSEYSEVTANFNLNLWAGDDPSGAPDEDNLSVHLTFYMSPGGSTTMTVNAADAGVGCHHATQIAIEGRITAG